ncbi:hypothetical protein B0H16DRAFT_1453131 [Mycena metata]|uniref:Uncharacterized protein n=1 Tax=Mycena metata TaxID=1033252 RepID=A0AAD7JNA1_9AGAR|nr:hypothetical protein B0H16DRAFT_1453131 [Mycena metata]
MTSTGNPSTGADGLSAAKTEYYSAPSLPGVDPTDVATNDEHSVLDGNHPASNLNGGSPRTTPSLPQYIMYFDNDGRPFLRDAQGMRFEIVAADNATSQASEPVGPTHYSDLFGPSTRGLSTELDLSESTPANVMTGDAGDLPDLDLDINPDELSSKQMLYPCNPVFQFFPLSVPVALKLIPIVLPSPPDTSLHTPSYPAPFR